MVGKILQERYEIIKAIGLGGMAEVYLAKDLLLDRFVAVKVLRTQYIDNEILLEQFKSEARSAARLIHPSIVNVFDVCEEDNLNYIVMEYVEGLTLKSLEERNDKIAPYVALDIASQLASALSQAHKRNIIHCDIKPQNILLDENFVPKIVDFGISKIVSRETMAFTSSVVGSVHYISPEQAEGRPLTSQSDIYSLGIVLYEMLTGTVPFDGTNVVAVAKMQVERKPAPLSDYLENIPEGLQEIIDKAMAKDLQERYQHVDDMRRDILNVKMKLAAPVAIENLYLANVKEELSNTIINKHDDIEDGATIVVKSPKSVTREIKENNNRKPLMKLAIKFLLMLILVFGIIGAWFWKSTPSVSVPDVTGLTVVDAQKKLEADGFKVELTETVDDKVGAGRVISQNPKNTDRKQGATIKLVISAGIVLADIPKVEGLTLEDATKLLVDKGYEIGNVIKVKVEKTAKNIVVKQLPTADSKAPIGTKVDIEVNDSENAIKIPVLIGNSINDAMAKLKELGFNDVAVVKVKDNRPNDTVISVQPTEGLALDKGDKIVLTISENFNTNTGTSTSGQYVEFIVPGKNDSNNHVKIVVTSNGKRNVILDSNQKGGVRLRRRVDANSSKVEFIVNDNVVEVKQL